MRQVISDFLDRLHNTAGTISLREESDKMVQIYSDERYSLNDLAAILEDDVTILLSELGSESAAIERDKGNEYWENVHKSNTFLISGVIRFLIDRAAGVRVFLSDDFLLQHEDNIFLNTRFANYVRNEYKAKGKPQQKHIEAPRQPIGGNSGELAGNGNENAPEGSNEESEFIKLPLELQTKDKRAEKIFTEAYKEGWITERNDGGYQWKGFGNTNKRGNFIAREMKCAYLCAQTYGYYKNGYYHNSDGDSPPWNELGEFFGIKNLSGFIGDAEAAMKKQSWRKAIDNLISSATK